MTTLHDVGRVLGRSLDSFLLGSHSFMVTAYIPRETFRGFPLSSKVRLPHGFRMMVKRYPNLKEEVGSSNPGYENSSLLDGKLARW